jgi:hypothetical protein
MNNRQLMILVSAVLFAALFLMGVGVVQARPAERIIIPTSGSFVLAECDGFEVIDEFEGRAVITEHYNQNGELVKLMYQQFDHDRVYNSVTGFSVRNRFAVNQTIYPEEGEIYIRGIGYNITVPGYGIVMFDSGLGVYYNVEDQWVLVKFAGNYRDDPERLCAAMDR